MQVYLGVFSFPPRFSAVFTKFYLQPRFLSFLLRLKTYPLNFDSCSRYPAEIPWRQPSDCQTQTRNCWLPSHCLNWPSTTARTRHGRSWQPPLLCRKRACSGRMPPLNTTTGAWVLHNNWEPAVGGRLPCCSSRRRFEILSRSGLNWQLAEIHRQLTISSRWLSLGVLWCFTSPSCRTNCKLRFNFRRVFSGRPVLPISRNY